MDNEKNLRRDNKLFDEALIDELNDMKSAQSQNAAEEKAEANPPIVGKMPEKTEKRCEIGEEMTDGSKPDENGNGAGDSANKKIFIIRVLAVAVGVLGIIMLISGMVLHRLDEESRKTPEKAQMPEKYIEEFFSDENFKPDIEKYIEPEA